ncbi:hypothetical protein ABEF92_003367 [Exophiala dermatitidis]|uniref:Lipocalin-like domain-containing protein n=1 Tax=Exophiala dermatitidis (strain ATCC 34100 / CBS 525.76 / NIH/UT8656) TaxID=858893 RepID=H6BN02_EXODN|nr:uncharacterized protein HMPREF1120_01325 [Exophiala dermatitidis NIH/UT8656]EHY53125.1 hypothetical protein HMPREF1120_01325 [Exophiala dermatitidis NIH/UT8656]
MADKTPTFLSRLLGTWELLSFVAINVDDPKDITYPMGEACKGQIMYSEDGYMAAVLQWGYVESYQTDWFHASMEEFANAGRKTMAYCGPFYLNEQPGDHQRVFHHAEISIPPNWNDTIQLRLAQMTEEGGETILTLGPECPMQQDGVSRVLRLRWHKLPRNESTKAPDEHVL